MVNVTCSACTRPLLAFQLNNKGEYKMIAHKTKIKIQPTGPYHVICGHCGALEPFPRELLGQR